ncbi:hypothetical protein J6590_058756 [Homalodisca vitripennis]|nr:hypothetical protein J6590_058756 [Homalodisca vitripennis]
MSYDMGNVLNRSVIREMAVNAVTLRRGRLIAVYDGFKTLNSPPPPPPPHTPNRGRKHVPQYFINLNHTPKSMVHRKDLPMKELKDHKDYHVIFKKSDLLRQTKNTYTHRHGDVSTSAQVQDVLRAIYPCQHFSEGLQRLMEDYKGSDVTAHTWPQARVATVAWPEASLDIAHCTYALRHCTNQLDNRWLYWYPLVETYRQWALCSHRSNKAIWGDSGGIEATRGKYSDKTQAIPHYSRPPSVVGADGPFDTGGMCVTVGLWWGCGRLHFWHCILRLGAAHALPLIAPLITEVLYFDITPLRNRKTLYLLQRKVNSSFPKTESLSFWEGARSPLQWSSLLCSLRPCGIHSLLQDALERQGRSIVCTGVLGCQG